MTMTLRYEIVMMHLRGAMMTSMRAPESIHFRVMMSQCAGD